MVLGEGHQARHEDQYCAFTAHLRQQGEHQSQNSREGKTELLYYIILLCNNILICAVLLNTVIYCTLLYFGGDMLYCSIIFNYA